MSRNSWDSSTARRMAALGHHRIRMHASLIGELERGETTLRRAMVDPRAEKMPVHRLIRGVRGVGWTKANRACWKAGVDPGKSAGRLTARQRGLIVEALTPYHEKYRAVLDRL